MPAELLLDTGAWVALLDKSERQHQVCVEVLEGWTGVLVTTEAVLTEAMYLVSPSRRAQEACLSFLLRGAVQLVPQSIASLKRVAELMEKYADVPMDYADATLVALAEELGTDQVFTLDRNDFSVYRLPGRKPFFLLP